MAKYLLVCCSLLFFILIHWALPVEPYFRNAICGILQNPLTGTWQVKCPYKKVNLSWLTGNVNPCPGLHQPICGTNFVTFENPCILCIESLKSHGKIRFQNDGEC
ncbi:serine protease inhibitor Kazal-type 14 [Mustela erminea]|uniref:serine protease inhibitor Kazal-type 14 n=1 Tax=Mustela erminea TaxID=36723 RepID=UPI001386A58B|nr:serine protease inhibitor Kazal-type 14 [Mustela erminea]